MANILVVDDEPGLRDIISVVLSDDGHEVITASSGEAALELFKNNAFPIVMTDIFMEKMTGIDLLHEIKQLSPATEVVIMTSNASLESATAALRSGAFDYLTKPFEDLEAISSIVQRAAEKVEQGRKKETKVAHLERVERNANELEQLNTRLQYLANRDALTKLYNRRYFLETLEREFLRAQRHTHPFSVVFVDLDHFKQYNDTFGHPAGDDLLTGLAELITKCARGDTIAARYGGEEFVLLLPETLKDDAYIFAERLRKNVEEYPFPGRESQPLGQVSLSLGVAAFPEDGSDCAALIARADEAMYQAKNNGRNRVVCC